MYNVCAVPYENRLSRNDANYEKLMIFVFNRTEYDHRCFIDKTKMELLYNHDEKFD